MALLPLTILGGAAQVGGFGLTFYELLRTQQREFPEYVPVPHRALRWVARTRPTQARAVEIDLAPARASSSGSPRIDIQRGPGDGATGRLERLENEMADLRRRQEDDHTELQRRITGTSADVMRTATATQTQLNELEARRRESLRKALFFEKLGVVFFVVGTVLSVLGSSL
jgi:hypothetical protein